MKKTLIALGLALLAAILIAACAESTGAPVCVEPAMEGSVELTRPEGALTTAATSELFTETTSQATESESATQAEAAASFSAGTTTQALATSTTRAATSEEAAAKATTTKARTATQAPVTAAPYEPPVTAAATTTTTFYVPPATMAALQIDRGAQEMVVMDMEYLNEVVATLNRIRAERGLAPMIMNNGLMESSLAHAKKMAEAGTSFHSDPPPGFESVGYVPYHVFTAQMLGEDLTTHVSNFTQDGYFSVGIAVVKRGDYLYAVMQGNR